MKKIKLAGYIVVIVIIVLITALCFYAQQKPDVRVDNETIEWQTFYSDEFDFSISYPRNCILSFMEENPFDEKKTMFTLSCSSNDVISVGYVYYRLIDSYIADRRQNTNVVREEETSDHALLQLSRNNSAKGSPSVVTYLKDKKSYMTLEIFGPTINEPEIVNLYNQIIDRIKFDSIK